MQIAFKQKKNSHKKLISVWVNAADLDFLKSRNVDISKTIRVFLEKTVEEIVQKEENEMPKKKEQITITAQIDKDDYDLINLVNFNLSNYVMEACAELGDLLRQEADEGIRLAEKDIEIKGSDIPF
jgi:hypothetical protein